MALSLSQFAQGDTNYIGKHNANYQAIQDEVNLVETTYQALSQRSQPGGYPVLDSNGRVPASQLPDLSVYQLRSEKNVANGYAGLDATGHLDPSVLPYITIDGVLVDLSSLQSKSQKNQPNGYCGLDAGGKVAAAQLAAANMPDMSATYITVTQKGAVNGVATLGADQKIPTGQLPDAVVLEADLAGYLTQALGDARYVMAAEVGSANGVASLGADGLVPTSQLPVIEAGSGVTGAELTANKDQPNGYAGLDGDGKLAVAAVPSQPVLIPCFYPGKPTADAVMLAFLPTVTVSIPASLTGTRCKVGTNATAPVTLSVQKNGIEVGTIAIAVDGSITLTAAAPISLTSADELTVVAPSSPDTTLADVRFTIHGTR